MVKYFRACWRSLTAGMFLLGLFWLPADVAKYEEALGPWRTLWVAIDRDALHWTFTLVLFTWFVWTDIRPWLRRRYAKPNWWAGLHSFTIRDFSCLVAGINGDDFEKSARAKAIASEIRGYVNSGHMPLMLETPVQPPRSQDYGGPGYVSKQIGNDVPVLRADLERLAIARKWELPWEPQERKKPILFPLKKGGNALMPHLQAEVDRRN